MKHNIGRAKAISAILRLQQFTVKELAEASGLSPDQLYPILKDCKDRHLVTTEKLNTLERKAHRPIQLYRLTSEPEARLSMAEDLMPLISTSQVEVQARAEQDSFKVILNGAASLLDEIEVQLSLLDHEASSASDSGIDVFKIIETKIAEAQEELENATYESGVKLSDLSNMNLRADSNQTEPWYSLKLAWIRFRNYAKRVSDSKQALETTLEDLTAQSEYATALRGLDLNGMSTKAIEHRLTELYRKTDNPFLREIFSTTLENLRECLHGNAMGRSVAPSWAIIHSLMGSAIRFCSDANLPLKMALFLLQQNSDDQCLLYNIANLRVLAGEPTSEAFSLWNKWAEGFLKSGNLWRVDGTEARYQTPYSYLAVISIPIAGLDSSVFSELEVKLGERATFSVVCQSPLATRGVRPYIAEPTLYDPLSCAPEIRLSESLGNNVGKLYVYGSLEKRVMNIPGVPTVRLASGLALSGVPSSKAWEIAHSLQSEQALILLQSFDERPIGETHVSNAVRQLEDRSGGQLLNSSRPKQIEIQPLAFGH